MRTQNNRFLVAMRSEVILPSSWIETGLMGKGPKDRAVAAVEGLARGGEEEGLCQEIMGGLAVGREGGGGGDCCPMEEEVGG